MEIITLRGKFEIEIITLYEGNNTSEITEYI